MARHGAAPAGAKSVDPGCPARERRLLEDDRGREHEDEDEELRPGERRERDPEQGEHVVQDARYDRRALQREHRPEEGRIGRDLGEQEGREDDPGHAHREQRDEVGGGASVSDAACEEEGGHRRGGHDVRVQDVRRVQRRRHVPVRERGRDQQRVELARVRDQHAVHVRKRRVQVRDADREALVEELVGHHEPVDDAPCDRRQADREPEPERDCGELEPDDGSGGPAAGRSTRARDA